ncbi:unnamed protein product [Prorocentrum cordatum]|uniref:Uncharacterized protein n=1 Tax=Prorocentrum cordatum TaxID=2364126 RepID=A0ABN9RIH5_9DINO|nr:unnamed protein product [Polarella glacialis]
MQLIGDSAPKRAAAAGEPAAGARQACAPPDCWGDCALCQPSALAAAASGRLSGPAGLSADGGRMARARACRSPEADRSSDIGCQAAGRGRPAHALAGHALGRGGVRDGDMSALARWCSRVWLANRARGVSASLMRRPRRGGGSGRQWEALRPLEPRVERDGPERFGAARFALASGVAGEGAARRRLSVSQLPPWALSCSARRKTPPALPRESEGARLSGRACRAGLSELVSVLPSSVRGDSPLHQRAPRGPAQRGQAKACPQGAFGRGREERARWARFVRDPKTHEAMQAEKELEFFRSRLRRGTSDRVLDVVTNQNPRESARRGDEIARQASALPRLRPPPERRAPRGRCRCLPRAGVDGDRDGGASMGGRGPGPVKHVLPVNLRERQLGAVARLGDRAREGGDAVDALVGRQVAGAPRAREHLAVPFLAEADKVQESIESMTPAAAAAAADQVLTALFGTRVFDLEETTIGDDIIDNANPWAKRVKADIFDSLNEMELPENKKTTVGAGVGVAVPVFRLREFASDAAEAGRSRGAEFSQTMSRISLRHTLAGQAAALTARDLCVELSSWHLKASAPGRPELDEVLRPLCGDLGGGVRRDLSWWALEKDHSGDNVFTIQLVKREHKAWSSVWCMGINPHRKQTFAWTERQRDSAAVAATKAEDMLVRVRPGKHAKQDKDPFVISRENLCRSYEEGQTETTVTLRVHFWPDHLESAAQSVPMGELFGADVTDRCCKVFIRGDERSPMIMGELSKAVVPERTTWSIIKAKPPPDLDQEGRPVPRTPEEEKLADCLQATPRRADLLAPAAQGVARTGAVTERCQPNALAAPAGARSAAQTSASCAAGPLFAPQDLQVPQVHADKFCRDRRRERALQQCMETGNNRLAGFCAEAESFGLDLRGYVRMRAELVQRVVASGGKAICYYSEIRYDETPMRTMCVDVEASIEVISDQLSLEVADHDPAAVAYVCIAPHVAKIVQTLRSENALLQLSNGTFLPVRCPIPCWLHSISGGKGENYFTALAASEVAPELPQDVLAAFARRQRSVCTGADGAVDSAERAVSAADKGLVALKTKCEAAGADSNDKRTEQSKRKFFGVKWLQQIFGHALGTFLMVSNVLVPLAHIVDNCLKAGSESRGQHVELEGLLGVPGGGIAGGRHALLAAECKFENQCFDELVGIMVNPAQWHLMRSALRFAECCTNTQFKPTLCCSLTCRRRWAPTGLET